VVIVTDCVILCNVQN